MKRRSFLGGLLAGIGALWVPNWLHLPWKTDWQQLVREEEERARMAQPATGHWVDGETLMFIGPPGLLIPMRARFEGGVITALEAIPADIDNTWVVSSHRHIEERATASSPRRL